jgi:hypothetical protein
MNFPEFTGAVIVDAEVIGPTTAAAKETEEEVLGLFTGNEIVVDVLAEIVCRP